MANGLLSSNPTPTPGMMEEEMVEETGASPIEDISDAAAPALDKAIEIAYSKDNFNNMVSMFKEGGPEGFPKAMGLSVLTVMQKLENDAGQPLPEEILAETGVALFQVIAEDMISSGAIGEITPEILTQAMTESINMWAEANPDRFDREEFQRVAEETLAQEQGGMAPEPMAVAPTGAEPMPPEQGGLLSRGM